MYLIAPERDLVFRPGQRSGARPERVYSKGTPQRLLPEGFGRQPLATLNTANRNMAGISAGRGRWLPDALAAGHDNPGKT